MRECVSCGVADRFPSGACRPCAHARYLTTREHRKARWRERYDAEDPLNRRARKFGLTVEQLTSLYAIRGPECWSCGLPESENYRALAIDHDHACCPRKDGCCGKCVRGLLCVRCNTLLGTLEKERPRIEALHDYLEKHWRL